jgi:hypothetical protein
MPHVQPQPLVVIRNQLLAFLVLHLLGSCVPVQNRQSAMPVVVACCSAHLTAIATLSGHLKLDTPYLHSR